MNQIETLYEKFRASTGVNTDTRKIREGNIFIALKGESFDGNQYATQALEAGALIAVVDDPAVVQGENYFLVDSGLEALQQLAIYHKLENIQ